MSANIPWDPSEFDPHHTTSLGNPVEIIDYVEDSDEASVRYQHGMVGLVPFDSLTPIPEEEPGTDPEPGTVTEEWGWITPKGYFVGAANEAAARNVVNNNSALKLVRRVMVDGETFWFDGDGEPFLGAAVSTNTDQEKTS